MNECKLVAGLTTNEDSVLFDKLYELAGEESSAKKLYAYLTTEQFRDEVFGDYAQGYKEFKETGKIPVSFIGRVDDNFEPSLKYDAKIGKNFFLDKDNERVFYPYERQGLNKFFKTNDVKAFARSLAFGYYDTYQRFDFDKLEFIPEDGAPLMVDYIDDFIAKKIDSMRAAPGTMLEKLKLRGMAAGLEHSKGLTAEWAEEVKAVYNSFKVDIQDDVQDETESYSSKEEGTVEDLIRKESWLKSSKDSINNNIKLLLSLVKSNEKNNFGDYEFVPFDDIFTTINRALANKATVLKEDGSMEDIYDIYMEAIEELANTKDYFKGLAEFLKDQSELFKNQFTSAFRLSRNNYLGSEIIKSVDEKGNIKIEYTVRNLSEVGSRRSNLLQSWYFNFKQLGLNDKDKLRKVKAYIQSEAIDGITERTLPAAKIKLREALGKLGVSFTDKGFDFYMKGLKHGEVTPAEEIQTVVSSYRRMEDAINNYLKAGNTSIFQDQKIFSDMSASEAFFMKEGSDASIYTVGKSKWVYSLESYLDQKINTWKKDVDILYNLYMASPYNKSSVYMKSLLAIDENGEMNREEAIANVSQMEIFNFNSVQKRGDSTNAADNKSLTETDSLADYVSKVLGHKKPGGKSYHKTALAADKATEYQIHYGKGLTFDANAKYVDGNFRVDSKITEIFYNYFKGEYTRMLEEREFATNNEASPENLTPNYHTKEKNAFKSLIFPSLSISFDSNTGEVRLPKLGFDLYNIDGSPKYKDLDLAEDGVIAEQVKGKINEFLAAGIGNTYDTLLDFGLFDYNSQGVLINKGVDSGIYNYYSAPAQGGIEQGVNMLAGDLFVNSVISQIEYSKMFTGDVAYYKNVADYKKRVPASYTDGQYMRIVSSNELYYNASVIESVEVGSVYLDRLKEMLPADIAEKYGYDKKGNGKINTADGQAWITPQRWKFIRHKIGKWDSSYDVIYDKMTKQKDPVYDNAELKKLAQPLKGVHFELDANARPIFLKYSQAVLLPNLIRGTELEILYNKMTEGTKGKDHLEDPEDYSKQVHELITRDGIKVGYKTPTVVNTKDGHITPDAVLTKMQLSNTHWKLQQDLSPKGPKNTDIGSQIQKVIFQGLVFNQEKDFYVGDETMTGDDLITHLNDLMSALSNKGRYAVAKRLRIAPGKDKTIRDESSLYNAIISNLANRTDTPANVIKALEAGLAPMAVSGQHQIFQNVFSTLVNDAMIKIKTNGGGFIQMSDFGLNRDEAKEQGIIFTPWFKDGSLHPPLPYTDKNGKNKIKPGGIFISGSMIAKYIPNYKDFKDQPDKLFGVLNEETGKYEGGMIDYDILQNIIGYRIPNQGLSSNDAFQVLGIMPEDVADTVIAYTGITTKTGSDYDIDKMYLMLPSFKATYGDKIRKYSDDFIKSEGITDIQMKDQLEVMGYVGTEEYDKETLVRLFTEEVLLNDADETRFHSDFHRKYDSKLGSAEKLIYAKPVPGVDMFSQSPEALRNMLIEGFKAVLTSEHAIASVMNPIDMDFMEKDIKNLFPAEKRPDMMDFDAVTDLGLKSEFRLGKAGLGQNVNALVDAVRGAMGNLYMYKYYIGKGNTLLEDDDVSSKFDEEYSEPLSEADLKAYLSDYNLRNANNPTTMEELAKLTKIKLADSMTAMANGFVDIAKDSYITRGNWVTQTNNVGFMLLRAGVHPFYVNAFIGQPVIKDYVKFLTNSESIIIDEGVRNARERFIIKMVSEIADKDNGNPTFAFNGVSLKRKDLIKAVIKPNFLFETSTSEMVNRAENSIRTRFGIKQLTPEAKVFIESTKAEIAAYLDEGLNTKDADGNEIDASSLSLDEIRGQYREKTPAIQMAILDKFLEWQEQAKKLTKSVSASKIDVDGKGKNITSLIVYNNIINGILNNDREAGELSGFESKLIRKGKDTFLNTYRKNGLGFNYDIMKANPKFFLAAQKTVVSTFNAISNSIYGETLQSQGLADKLENAFHAYIMSGFPALQMSKDKRVDLLANLPARFEAIKKNPAYKNNLLIDSLYPSETEAGGFSIAMPNLKKTTSVKDAITDGWRDLFETDPEFAEDLVKYSYLISGFNASKNQFHEFIPYEWFNKNRFNSYLKNLDFIGKNEIDGSFIDQFFRHNVDDPSLVAKVYKSDIEPLIPGDPSTTTGVMIKNTAFKHERKAPYFIQIDTHTEDGPPIVRYYTFQGYSKKGTAFYLRTSPLGQMDTKGNKLVEYNFKNGDYNNTDTKTVIIASQVRKEEINTEVFRSVRTSTLISKEYPQEVMADDTDTMYGIDSMLQEGEVDREDFSSIRNIEVTSEEIVKPNNNGPIINTIVTYTPENITSLKPNEVFVFGSNTEGRHGAGAAKAANDKFGAVYGQAEGLQGQSYAIVTKDLSKGKKSVDIDFIADQVMNLSSFAKNNPDKTFYVTKIGAGLGGFTTEESMDILRLANDLNPFPPNMVLPKEFYDTVEAPKEKVLSEIKVGDIVEYKGERFVLWNINETGKAQLTDLISGEKFSGTPNVDKLTHLEKGAIVPYNNGTSYIVAKDRIISTATGKFSFIGDDKSSRIQRNYILEKAMTGKTLNTQENVVEEAPKEKSPTPFTFTYDGVSIGTEFELGEEQKIALEKSIDHVQGRGADKTVFTIEGYAGTGKTTIIGFLQKWLETKGGFGAPSIKYVAPTHAATAQLAFTTAKLGNTELPFTLASTFYYKTDQFTGVKTPTLTFKAMEGGFDKKLFIVDEASMVSAYDIAGFVKAVENVKGQIIFMGDPKQIPEVSTQNSEAKLLSQVFTDMPKAQLNRVYRQKKSTLLDILTHIRTANKFESLIATETDGTLEILPGDEFRETLINDFKTDPDNTIYISYTNKSVQTFNKAIKSVLNGKSEPVIGEKIVGYGGYNNKQVSDGDIANSIQYTITSMTPRNRDGATFMDIQAVSPILKKLVDLEVRGVSEVANSNYLPLGFNDSFVFNSITSEMLEANNNWLSGKLSTYYKRILDAEKNRNWRLSGEIKKELSEFLKGIDLGADYFYDVKVNRMVPLIKKVHGGAKLGPVFSIEKGIDYGYGITTHKSQGMTVDNVYLDVANIQQYGPRTPIITEKGEVINTEQNALYYVGMSRASKKVVINRDKTDFTKVIDTSDNGSDPFKC